jgi:hypothetical protein
LKEGKGKETKRIKREHETTRLKVNVDKDNWLGGHGHRPRKCQQLLTLGLVVVLGLDANVQEVGLRVGYKEKENVGKRSQQALLNLNHRITTAFGCPLMHIPPASLEKYSSAERTMSSSSSISRPSIWGETERTRGGDQD